MINHNKMITLSFLTLGRTKGVDTTPVRFFADFFKSVYCQQIPSAAAVH